MNDLYVVTWGGSSIHTFASLKDAQNFTSKLSGVSEIKVLSGDEDEKPMITVKTPIVKTVTTFDENEKFVQVPVKDFLIVLRAFNTDEFDRFDIEEVIRKWNSYKKEVEKSL